MKICYLENASRLKAVYFFAFVCVCAKLPKKIRSIQVLLLIITFYGRVLRSIILRRASEGRKLFGCNSFSSGQVPGCSGPLFDSGPQPEWRSWETRFFFCVCLRLCKSTEENSIDPSSVPDHNLLRPCVTIHNPQVSDWRKKTFWLQQSSIQTIRSLQIAYDTLFELSRFGDLCVWNSEDAAKTVADRFVARTT